MKGNIYYTIPRKDENNKVSTKIGKRYITIITPTTESVRTKKVVPTWLELQQKISDKFGSPTYKKLNNEEFLILEFEASFLKGEVEELMNNGVEKDVPNYTVWEKDEINDFTWDLEDIT